MNRRKEFRRNEKLELLLAELSNDLEPAESGMCDQFVGQPLKHPLILVFGPMRSGTTLFMQWLSSFNELAYPTNFLSRFYYAPLVGAKIQQLLTNPEYSFRDELSDLVKFASFESFNGKTRGALSPNEFWYFWNRHIRYGKYDFEDDAVLEKRVDQKKLLAEFVGMTTIFDKPFTLKAMKYNHNAQFLNRMFDKSIFVRLHRNVESNVESVLEARVRQFGSVKYWYSLKGPEYMELSKMCPTDQVVGQVLGINRSLDKVFSNIPASRQVNVGYEEFCKDPSAIYEEFYKKLNQYGDYLPEEYGGVSGFEVTRPATETKIDISASLDRLKRLFS